MHFCFLFLFVWTIFHFHFHFDIENFDLIFLTRIAYCFLSIELCQSFRCLMNVWLWVFIFSLILCIRTSMLLHWRRRREVQWVGTFWLPNKLQPTEWGRRSWFIQLLEECKPNQQNSPSKKMQDYPESYKALQHQTPQESCPRQISKSSKACLRSQTSTQVADRQREPQPQKAA